LKQEIKDRIGQIRKGIVPRGYKKTKIGIIPQDWDIKVLGELLTKIIGGGTPRRKNPEYYNGSIPWATVKDLTNENYKTETIEYISEIGLENSSAKIVDAKNFIISTRMGLGRGFINKVDMAINQDLKGLYPDKSKLDVVFLMYWYKSQKKRIENLGAGSTVKGIDLNTLRSLNVFNPTLEEQQKIANILSTWDRAIELKESLIKEKEEQKKGLMEKLFEGVKSFSKVGNLIKESKIVEKEPSIEKLLTVRLHLEGVFHRTLRGNETVGATRLYRRNAGQFIYGKQNFHNGAFGIVPDQLDGYLSSSDIPTFDFNKHRVNPLYFFYYWSRKDKYKKLENFTAGTGSKRLNPTEFYNISMGLPTLEEQQHIAKILSTADKEIELLKQEVEQLKEQKKGLMQLLLTGIVRVKEGEDSEEKSIL